jgi:threonine dehydrogenase-like Zn-dependent dehydrogenase
MTMRQLTYLSPGKFEWQDVPAPKIDGPRQAIVKPLAVARCDLDFYVATGFAPYPGPFAFGHEAVAEVIDAGDAANVSPGDPASPASLALRTLVCPSLCAPRTA